MKAARFHGKQDVRIEEVGEPSPGRNEVKLRNAYCGICGSDLHVFYDPDHSGLDFSSPHPLTGATPPQILGHEFSGTVVELGEGVEQLQVGDQVAVWPIYNCGSCAACEQGMVNVCCSIGFHGLTSCGGGIAEFTTLPADMVHKLPDQVDLRLGALVEPMAVAWHAVRTSSIRAEQTALVVGAGPIGIGLWFALKAHGVDVIVISEPSSARRAAVLGLGATQVIDPTSVDVGSAVTEITGGRGVDVAFDAAGVGTATLQALSALVPGGKLVVVALHEKSFDFNPILLVWTEVSVTGTLGYTHQDYDQVIAAMSRGHYSTLGWVDEVGVEELTDTFASLRAGAGIKVLVKL